MSEEIDHQRQWDQAMSALREYGQRQRSAMAGMDDRLLAQYICGAASPADQAKVRTVLAEHPELRRIVETVTAALGKNVPIPAHTAPLVSNRPQERVAVMDSGGEGADIGPLAAVLSGLFIYNENLHDLLARVEKSATDFLAAEYVCIVAHDSKTDELLSQLRASRRNILVVPTHDVAGKPNGVLVAMNPVADELAEPNRLVIQLLADRAGVAIQVNQLRRREASLAALQGELNSSYPIQNRLSPPRLPHVAGLDLAASVVISDQMGGDGCDLWRLQDGSVGIFVGDASGHGMGATFLIEQTRAIIRALAEVNPDASWLLTRVNGRLYADLRMGNFVTAFVGSIAPATGEMRWSSAGHGPILLRASRNGRWQFLGASGLPLGVDDSVVLDATATTILEPGGMVCVTTDGVFEAQNPSREMFGIDRLVQILSAHPQLGPSDLLSLLRDEIRQWQGGSEKPTDDQTIVVIQRT